MIPLQRMAEEAMNYRFSDQSTDDYEDIERRSKMSTGDRASQAPSIAARSSATRSSAARSSAARSYAARSSAARSSATRSSAGRSSTAKYFTRSSTSLSTASQTNDQSSQRVSDEVPTSKTAYQTSRYRPSRDDDIFQYFTNVSHGTSGPKELSKYSASRISTQDLSTASYECLLEIPDEVTKSYTQLNKSTLLGTGDSLLSQRL